MYELSRGAGYGDLRAIADLTIVDRKSPVMLRTFVIGPPDGDTARRMIQWEFDSEVNKYFYPNEKSRPQSPEDVYALYKSVTRNHAIAAYEIVYEDKPVGFASLRDTGLPKRQALMGVMIGDKYVWGKHIATRVIAMLLVCAQKTDLLTVRAKIYHENIAATCAAAKYASAHSTDAEKIYDYFDFDLTSLNAEVFNVIDPIVRK